MFRALITKGQYQFLARIKGVKPDKARLSKSSPPIPWLKAEVITGWFLLLFPRPFTHLLMAATGSTLYALLPSVTTELSFHQTISFLFICSISINGHFITRSFFMFPVAWRPCDYLDPAITKYTLRLLGRSQTSNAFFTTRVPSGSQVSFAHFPVYISTL